MMREVKLRNLLWTGIPLFALMAFLANGRISSESAGLGLVLGVSAMLLGLSLIVAAITASLSMRLWVGHLALLLLATAWFFALPPLVTASERRRNFNRFDRELGDAIEQIRDWRSTQHAYRQEILAAINARDIDALRALQARLPELTADMEAQAAAVEGRPGQFMRGLTAYSHQQTGDLLAFMLIAANAKEATPLERIETAAELDSLIADVQRDLDTARQAQHRLANIDTEVTAHLMDAGLSRDEATGLLSYLDSTQFDSQVAGAGQVVALLQARLRICQITREHFADRRRDPATGLFTLADHPVAGPQLAEQMATVKKLREDAQTHLAGDIDSDPDGAKSDTTP